MNKWLSILTTYLVGNKSILLEYAIKTY